MRAVPGVDAEDPPHHGKVMTGWDALAASRLP